MMRSPRVEYPLPFFVTGWKHNTFDAMYRYQLSSVDRHDTHTGMHAPPSIAKGNGPMATQHATAVPFPSIRLQLFYITPHAYPLIKIITIDIHSCIETILKVVYMFIIFSSKQFFEYFVLSRSRTTQ